MHFNKCITEKLLVCRPYSYDKSYAQKESYFFLVLRDNIFYSVTLIFLGPQAKLRVNNSVKSSPTKHLCRHGERGCIAPTHSRPRHQMEVSGQRHAPAALYPREKDRRLGGPQSRFEHRG